jgi:hypothetical protein
VCLFVPHSSLFAVVTLIEYPETWQTPFRHKESFVGNYDDPDQILLGQSFYLRLYDPHKTDSV